MKKEIKTILIVLNWYKSSIKTLIKILKKLQNKTNLKKKNFI